MCRVHIITSTIKIQNNFISPHCHSNNYTRLPPDSLTACIDLLYSFTILLLLYFLECQIQGIIHWHAFLLYSMLYLKYMHVIVVSVVCTFIISISIISSIVWCYRSKSGPYVQYRIRSVYHWVTFPDLWFYTWVILSSGVCFFCLKRSFDVPKS